jgi:hypothetical protein
MCFVGGCATARRGRRRLSSLPVEWETQDKSVGQQRRRPTTARYLLYEMAQGSERTGSSVILARLCCKSKMSDTSQKSCLFLSLSLSGRLISDSVRLFSPYFWPSACCFTHHRHSVSAVLIIMDSLLFLLSSPPPLAYI